MFDTVMQQYYDLRGAIGCAGAIDYSGMTGGSGPKYSDHEKGVSTINFVADVEKVAKKKLAAEEWGLFKSHYIDRIDELDNTPNELHNNLKTKLARLFIVHELHPVSKYFNR